MKVSQLFLYIRKSEFVRSIFFRTILVFLVVIVLVVTVVYYSFGSEINRAVISESKRQLRDIKESVSSRMTEVMSIAYNVGQDPIFLLEPIDDDKYSDHKMTDMLSRYLIGNRFVKHLAYYRLSEPNKIYTSSGMLAIDRFWDAYIDCDNYTELTFLEKIKSTSNLQFISLLSNERGRSFFAYVCPLPQLTATPKAFAIALIPISEIESILSTQIENSHGQVTLFDANNNEICKVSTLDETIAVTPSTGREHYMESNMERDGAKYIVQEQMSEANGWKYVSVVRLGDIASELASTQVLVIVAVIALMIVAVWLILVGIINKYQPISQLALTLTGENNQGDRDGVIDEKKLITSTIATLKSDSEQKQKLEVAYQEATEASKAKSAFLSNMSHDIRTPMNAIIGMTGIALKHIDDKEYVKECLNKVVVSSNYLLDIINNVLDMSRIESGKITLSRETIALPELLNGIETIIRTSIEEKQQHLVIQAEHIMNENVVCDTVRLTQICMNILSNAVKFTPCGGTIRMSISQAETELEGFGDYTLTFSDTGIGMPPEFVEKVFDSFSRAQESGVSKVEGTGLGMSIAKNLVELMGGSIVCESEEGVGTTFTVKLRLELAGEGADVKKYKHAGATEYEAVSFEGKRVLLAEDNDMNREIARRLISETGAEVYEAINGKEALEAFERNPAGYFDIILMDIMMPVMDGCEAAGAIRALPRKDAATIPIYAMTANTFSEDVLKVKQVGMNGHIGKPYTPRALYAVISEAVELNGRE